jgi:hypothetical protein
LVDDIDRVDDYVLRWDDIAACFLDDGSRLKVQSISKSTQIFLTVEPAGY